MANNKKSGKQTKGSSNEKGKSKVSGLLFTLMTLIITTLVIAIVFGAAFYLVIHNNVNGMADKYRKTIQNIPIAKLALPAVPDPLDPKYMTADEITAKYKEFRLKNDELNNLLDEAKTKQEELQKYKDEYDNYKAQNDKTAQDLKERQAALDEKELQLNDLKKKIDELIANNDKEGFKNYFENVSPEIAKQIYAEVVKQQQIDAQMVKFAQTYQTMDASAAAKIMEQLGSSKLDMIAETLKSMKKESSAEIMAAMTPSFAAKVTEKLNALYKGN